MIGNTSTISDLRLAIYRALEESSYRTVQDLAFRLDSGTPATQAQVRDILHAEPEVFWPYEERWDLAIFHRFEVQPHLFRGRGIQVFDQDKFLNTVLTEALRLKGAPIDLVTLAEKYLLKIRKSLGSEVTKQSFPTDRRGILRRISSFLARSRGFHLLHENAKEYIWIEPTWPEPRAVVVQAPAFQLAEDFLDRAAEYLETRRDQPVRLLEILEHVLEIDANHSDFPSAFSLANASLSADTETFAQVQEQAWMLAAHLPADIEEIPARVAIPRWRNPQEEKIIEETDELPSESLAEAAEFVGEEEADATEVQFDENYLNEVFFVLPYHWRQSGVLKVNARERHLFPNRPARVRLEFEDRLTRQTFPVWLNNDTRYLYGLEDWYAANLVPAGGVFYIQRSSGSKYDFTIWINEAQAHTFDEKQFFCEVDEDTYIEEDRLRDLEALRAKVEAAQATIKDVMCDLFESYPPDTSLHYKQIWSQVHVIRPTTRRTVAAILSMFPCFYQTEPGSGRWLYAPTLRDTPLQCYPPRVRPKPVSLPKPVRPVPRHWLVPIHAASWEDLARPAKAGDCVFLVPWRGRSRVAKEDQLVFYDADSKQVLAAARVLRPPVRDADSGRREVAVQPLLETFTPVPYADVAGTLTVPQPEPDGFPVEITPEDVKFLLGRLRPLVAPEPTEPALEELLKQAIPKAKPTPPAPGEIIPHTYGPNPTIGAFIAHYGRPYDPQESYERTAFAYPVKAGKNTPIYNAHSYHTKVPPQGIEPYIEHYTEPGDIILDPFCGSGMTGVAALKLGRRVILNDLSPAATHIAYNYCTPVDVEALKQEVERTKAAVKEEFDWLYGTTCDRCGGPATILYTIWSDVFVCARCGEEIVLWNTAMDPDTGRVSREFACPYCYSTWRKTKLKRLRSDPVVISYECSRCKPKRAEHSVTASEKMRIAEIEAARIPYWYPTIPFDESREMWRGAHRDQGITDVSRFYTKRNLWALARLWDEVGKTSCHRLMEALRFGLTAINAYISKKQSFGGGGGGVSGTLYTPSLQMEKHVGLVAWRKFQKLLEVFDELQRGTPALVTTQSATDLANIPDASIDYIFTDPPFGSNIFYADCSLLWESWLGHLTDEQFEAVVHVKHKHKNTLPDYTRLMTESFREMYRVLKPSRWASVIFHNSDDRVWRAIQQAAEDAGFDLANAVYFDKKQRSFKGVRGEKGLENVTNFDIVLNLHKKAEARPVAQPEAQDRIERLIVAAVDNHLRSGPAPDYRTSQYLHSLALRTLLNEKISIELTWEQLERILQRFFRHINCHWYLPKEAITLSGHGFLVRSETTAVSWLEHVLGANPQKLSDLKPQWQIATLGAGSRIKRTLEELLEENFWKDGATGLWCVPTAAQREILKRRRVKPQQLRLDLEIESGPQLDLGLR